MGQILIKKESLDALKSALETLKGEFNTSITDIKTNLLNISNNWKGKKADETLSVIETLNKTNSDLLIRINENIEYIESVISTLDKVESVEVETKPVETPLPTASPTPTPTQAPTPAPTQAPTQEATATPAPTQAPIQEPTATAAPTQASKDSFTNLDNIPIIEPTPKITHAENQSLATNLNYSNYDGSSALIVGSKEYQQLSDLEKTKLNSQYLEAIEEGKRTGGVKGGLTAALNFYFENNLRAPFSSSGRHDLYMEGLDTNLKQGKNAPNSASWIQMLIYDVTGEKNANLRLKNNTNLSGTFLQGNNMKEQIPNVSAGDIFFKKPLNPSDSASVGHAYFVVGKENDEILVAELGSKGFTITPKTKEELSKLDGLTILDKNI